MNIIELKLQTYCFTLFSFKGNRFPLFYKLYQRLVDLLHIFSHKDLKY